MNDVVTAMLAKYGCKSADEYERALVEIIQEIALLGLWRAKFYEKAAFYGGTALRVLYGLDRFSEDLDFSLLKPDHGFDLRAYHKFVAAELEAYDFSVEIAHKEKSAVTAVESAFIKANTYTHLLRIGVGGKVQRDKILKIKFEVDTDPPDEFATEARFLLQPLPFSVLTFAPPDLFAGKMHAVLCRAWGRRVKGRDWYDMVWYVGRSTPLGIRHLERRMIQSGHWDPKTSLTPAAFRIALQERIESLDIAKARDDVRPFLKDAASLDVWSKPFFEAVADRIKTV